MIAKVEYKPPETEKWQVLELVANRVHRQVWILNGSGESERKFQAHREVVRKASESQGMGELLVSLFGKSVLRRTLEDPGKPMSESIPRYRK